MATDNNDFTHEFQIYSTDLNAGTMGTGKFLLFDNNINAVKVEDVSNIKIGGGEEGQVLVTDGEGNLTWATSSGGGGVAVNADWNSSSGASRILNKPDLTAYLPKSGGTLTGKLNAAQGAGTAGGYSFGGTEGGADTGMFSNADGILDFYANDVKIVTVTSGGVTSTQAITLPGNPTSNLQAATKQYVDSSISALNNFSGNYNDLTNKPTVATSAYIGTTQVAFNRSSGALTLTGVSIDGNAATVSNGVYTTGTYANPAWITSLAYSKLTDAPTLATVATSGAYADLTGKPSLATVATSGSYSDLTNRPTIFSGAYADLTGKPTLFDGAYLSLTGLPNLAAVATSGSYDDLSNKPSIPDLTGYATESWVTSQGFGSGTGVTSYNDLTDKPSIPSSLSDLGITAGSNGQVLTLNSSLVPVWATPSGGGQTFDQSLNTDDIVTFDLLTVTDSAGIKNFNGDRITNTYSDGTLYVSGSDTQTPVSILIGGAGPRNEWAFTPDGNLTLPAGGDIKDSNGNSVLGSTTDRLVNGSYSFILNENGGIDATNGTVGPTQAGEFGFGANTGADAVIKANGGFSTWTFKTDNNLQLPAGGDIIDSNGNSVLGGGSGVSLPADANGFLANDGTGTLSWASAPARLVSPNGDFEVTLDDTGAVVLSSYGVIKNPDHVNIVSDGWAQLQWVDTNTLDNADPNSTQGPTNWIYVDQSGIHVETNINSNIGDSTSRYDWLFDINGNLTMPSGSDIKDVNGNSVLGGGSGVSLPANASGYLTNDGSGNLAWAAGDGTFSGDYNDLINKPTLPGNEITNTDGYNTYSVSVSETGIVTMNTARGSIEFGAQPEVGAPTHLHIMRPAGQEGSNDLYFGDDYNYVRLPGLYGEGTQGVEIGSSYNSETPNVWRFETWGDLNAPGGITANGTVAGNGLRINNQNDLVFDANGSVITEQRPGEGYNFYATDTVAVTGNGSGAKLNISFGAGDESYQVSVNDGGTYSYLVGDQLKVTGDALGGVTPDNDLLVTVSQLYPGDNGNPWAVFGVTIDSGTPVGYQDGLHIRTNGNEWTFGTDGSIRLPNKGSVEIFDDGVTVKHSNYAQLQSNDSYVWVESHSASIEVDNNRWDFNSDGSMRLPNNVVQNTGGTISVSNGAPTVIYTTTSSDRHTVKLLVQAEGSDGENGNWDTQSCEILAVKSFRNNTVAASVYGLVYTSPNPLVTYNSQFNSATGNIEITAVAVQANGVYVRVHAIEISTAD